MSTESTKKADSWKAGKTSFTEDGIRMIELEAGSNVIKKLREDWQAFAAAIPPYPGGFEGRGIVICAGGLRYFTCAWINIHVLKKTGCSLPIEVWYTGNEFTPEVIATLTDLGVTCRNANDHSKLPIDGLALKPFAILNTRFKEVLYLDADNICTANPEQLFENETYRQGGTIFWPDIWVTDKNNPIWKIIDASDYDSIEQESGQILINKETCWKELNLCMYFNEQRQYYYTMLLGDKDTFRFAWKALQSPYYMIPKPVAYCGYTNKNDNSFFGLSMAQHDPIGNILFIHRNLLKWDITAPGETIWKEIRQFKADARQKVINGKYINTPNGLGFNVIDVQGEVETLDFRHLLGDLEKECLQILNALRDSPMYGRYLLHTYFCYFKPQYLHNTN
ncbi:MULTISPECIES: alpha-mannosyltransferase [Niastella]|uniref:Alpha 1,2-mannosyltransferase n=1 Tax=Niastella soli TaxID=2821487 RepID=A0ABS3YUW8_9BACT|nr:hypothetical protein [Niastella soli]MBO9201553.1 hypothetical protein [Niastella soli]